MDSVDYTKQLNRKSELFNRDLHDLKRGHKKELENTRETLGKRIESQADSYNNAKLKTEREQEKVVQGLRSEQAKSLSDKNRLYEQTVLAQQEDFNNERVANTKKWNQEVANLKDSFREETAKNDGREEKVIEVSRQNVATAKEKFENDFKVYKNEMQEQAAEFRDDYNKEMRDTQARHDNEKKQLLDGVVKKQNDFRDYTNDQVNKSRQNQLDHFIAQKKGAQDRFEEFSDSVNQRQKEFSENEVQRLREASVKGIQDKNKLFAEKYSKLEHDYNQDVRSIQRRVDAEKVTSGDTRKEYDRQLRETESTQHEQRRQTLLDQNVANTKFYNDKMTELKEDQQDELHRERIKAASKIVREKEATSLALQEKDFKANVVQDKANHNSTVRLNQERAKNVLDRGKLERQQKVEMTNLKENFKRGIEISEVRTQQSVDEIKQESVLEKRLLEKRLQTENAENTAYLKETSSTKFEKMKGDLESKILELQNQNRMIQQNADEVVIDMRIKSKADLEQQIASSQRRLEDLIAAEKENSATKELALKKTLRENQATFNKRMNDLAHNNQVKVKRLSNELTTAAKNDAAKYQSEIQVNKRYFARELQKLQSSNKEEREALITQYEDRIKQMQKVYVDKINDLKDFNKLENA